MLNICKLIFQISRSESNDLLFEKNSIIGQIFLANHYAIKYALFHLYFLTLLSFWIIIFVNKLKHVSVFLCVFF